LRLLFLKVGKKVATGILQQIQQPWLKEYWWQRKKSETEDMMPLHLALKLQCSQTCGAQAINILLLDENTFFKTE